MQTPSFADRNKPTKAEIDEIIKRAKPQPIEVAPLMRALQPVEMAALITASVEFWKFRVQREGPFGADFPTIADVAGDLYKAVLDIPVVQGEPASELSSNEPGAMAPAVLAAAIAATVEVWRSSAEDFTGYRSPAAPRRRPIEVIAAQVRAAIDVLTKRP